MKLSTLKKWALTLIIATGLSSAVSAQNDSILYHDHSFESVYYNSLDSNWAQYLIQITPTAYPAQLVGVRAWFVDATDPDQRIRFVAYKDLTGADLGCGTSAPIYTSPNRLVVPVDTLSTLAEDLTAADLEIATGDFYVGVSQTKRTSTIAIDTDTVPGWYQKIWYRENVFFMTPSWYHHNQHFGAWGQYGVTAYWKHISVGVEEQVTFTDNITIMPNPARTNADIYWYLFDQAKVTVELYNLLGQLQTTLVNNEIMTAGEQHINANLSGLEDGVYLCRLTVGDVVVTKKINVSR